MFKTAYRIEQQPPAELSYARGGPRTTPPDQPGHAANRVSSDPWSEPWPWEAGRMHTHGRWEYGHQGDACHNRVHLLQRPVPVSSRCVHSLATQSTHTQKDRQTQQHTHSTWLTQVHMTPGEGTWLYMMFNHVSSRKHFFIEREITIGFT